jgi:hypothetical protein
MEENKNIPEEQPFENIPEASPPKGSASGGEVERGEIPPAGGKIIFQQETAVPETGEQPLNELNALNDNMEVHHHTHASHGKKTWKAYFWEFLMLFLAVFCGFLAEYELEHVIERQREKKYMRSLITDLMADTAHLNEGFPRKEGRIAAIDSLFDYFSVHRDQKTIPANVHNLMRRSSWDRAYDRNNITMTQLKNSGNMRLIRKKNVADSILNYDFLWGRADSYYKETYWSNSGIINDYIKKIINDYSLLPYYKNNTSTAARLEGDAAGISVEINTTLLLEYLNHLHKIKTTIVQDKDFYRDIEKRAEVLIDLIKKEYDLE